MSSAYIRELTNRSPKAIGAHFSFSKQWGKSLRKRLNNRGLKIHPYLTPMLDKKWSVKPDYSLTEHVTSEYMEIHGYSFPCQCNKCAISKFRGIQSTEFLLVHFQPYKHLRKCVLLTMCFKYTCSPHYQAQVISGQAAIKTEENCRWMMQ